MTTLQDSCPTCNAVGDDPCVTASGKPAKARHKNRHRITVSHDAETDKTRFDRMVAQRRAASETERKRREKLPVAPSGERVDPEKFRPLQNRADRRRYGRTKTAGQGKRHRSSMAANRDRAEFYYRPNVSAAS